VRDSGGKGEYWDTGNTDGPGDWTWEFSQLAEQEVAQAEQLEVAGDRLAASQAYDRASVYFGLAKYPHIARTDAENTALDNQLAAYAKSFELAGYGYRVVQTTLDDATVTGLLHLPKPEQHPAPYPLVIGTNGLDVFGAESGPLVRDLLDRGIAVLMSDIPGTGINSAIPLQPDFERLWLVFLEQLRRDPAVNAARVGAFGMSFGGNAAVKLAMTREDDFLAVANICGPVHEVFTLSAAQVGAIDAMYRDGLVDRLHLPDGEATTIVSAARGFSLVSQGLIGQGQQTPGSGAEPERP
jgi:esterase FrsA